MNKEGASFSNECPVKVKDGCICPNAPECNEHLNNLKRSSKVRREEKKTIDRTHAAACAAWRDDHDGLTAGFTEAVSGSNIRRLRPTGTD